MSKNIIVSALVALVVGLGSVYVATNYMADQSNALGSVRQIIDDFVNGAKLGDEVLVIKNGTIKVGQNQSAWLNNTGKTVYVTRSQVGYESGTASSSWDFYVATSSAATLGATGLTEPTNTFFSLKGGGVATGSPKTIITSTSTDNGITQGSLRVLHGEYVVTKFVERFGCTVIGACETATSTNRGVSTFFWKLWINYTK